ncbi:hypothetical protein [Kitasatospora sp. NPDC088346]|uniref:hypothetical protein n=1 Tax=Kitasatospora sp. NPDC088346 TaxID=3364073 RepID=UPI0038143527
MLGFNPTSEHLAAYLTGWTADQGLLDALGHPLTVRVSETESTWAQFEATP